MIYPFRRHWRGIVARFLPVPAGAMFRDLDFVRRVDLQKVPCEYAEAILKLLVPVVQKSAPDDIKVSDNDE